MNIKRFLMSWPLDWVLRSSSGVKWLFNFRRGCQVQGINRLYHADPEEGGRHVHVQGRWCQHPQRCGRRWCPRWLRQVQAMVFDVQIWSLNEVYIKSAPILAQQYYTQMHYRTFLTQFFIFST